MSTKPILVVMAAGIGSRYGGLKQIDPVGSCGESILDYSLFDAHRAGFEKAVIIIKEAIREDFMSTVGKRLTTCPLQIDYAYQELTKIPEGQHFPQDRVKPFGTGHAVLCAKEQIGDAPFAVINADDYYGQSAFKTIFDQLSQARDGTYFDYCMVGYYLRNTLSDNGGVARGICHLDEEGYLTSLRECIGIEGRGDHAAFPTENGHWEDLELDTLVSMNLFGFTGSILKALEAGFVDFFTNELPKNPTKAEFFLPTVVNQLMAANKAKVKVLSSADRWYGVTYAADKPLVVNALAKMTAEGLYPDGLWK